MADLKIRFYAIVALCLLIAVFTFSASAQTPSPEQLLTNALELQEKAEYEQSSQLLKQAIPLFENRKKWSGVASCYNELSVNARFQNKLEKAEKYAQSVFSLQQSDKNISAFQVALAHQNLGMVEAKRGNYNQALKYLENGLSIAEQQSLPQKLEANLRSSIGSAYQDLGEYERAMTEFQQGVQLLSEDNPEHRKPLASLYNHIGVNYVNKGEFDKGLAYYQKELEISKLIYGRGHPDIAGVYNNLGGISFRVGDVGKAVNYFKKAAQTFEEAFGTNHPAVAMTYNNIGAGYFRLGNLKQSITYLEKSVEIKKQVQGATHPDVATGYNNIGGLYLDLGHYDKAKKYLHRSIAIREEALGPNHPKLTNTYSTLGNLYLEKGQPDSAISYFQREIEVTRNQRGEHHPYVANSLNNIGQSYSKQQFYKQALTYHQEALQVLSPSFNNNAYSKNPEITDLRYPNHAVDVFYQKGKTLQKAYQQRGELQTLKAGLHTFNRLSELLDYLQVGFQSEQSKLLMSRESHEMYEHAIQIAYQLFEHTGDRDYLEKALHFSEKSKTRVILELIKTQRAKDYAGIPDSLLSYEKELRNQVTDVQQGLNRAIESQEEKARTQRLRDSLFTLNRSLDNHLQLLEDRYPRYHNLKYNQEIPPTRDIQRALQQKDLTMVEYFYGDKSSWAFTVSGQHISATKLPHDSLLSQKIDRFRKSITQQKDSTYLTLGSELYSTLVEPVMDEVNHANVLFVPDGALNLLPFEALLTDNIQQPAHAVSFSTLPYLINDLSISYSPSASLSTLFRNQQQRKYSAKFAAFAPIFEFSNSSIKTRERDANPRWSPLPSSQEEVQQIAELFGENNRLWNFLFGKTAKPELFTQSKATEQNFKQQDLSKYKYLHLATHAFASDSATQRSGIVFQQSSNDNEDNILYADEIYTLELKNELVVLSACETGTGEIMQGEGIIGLSRAFQYAGVENLLVSLWKVDDRSTARLMINFYKQILDGKSYNWALRLAKRDLINHPIYAHPRYWAPFIFLGQ